MYRTKTLPLRGYANINYTEMYPFLTLHDLPGRVTFLPVRIIVKAQHMISMNIHKHCLQYAPFPAHNIDIVIIVIV